MEKIYLCLENGFVFQGNSFGADVEALGELVFDTSMVGYPETLTDNNYSGQIVMKTFPMIGNYGMVFDSENKIPTVAGFVVREVCEMPSNFRCEGTLSDYLKLNGIPAICDVDTRELTRILRENGTCNAAICKKVPDNFDFIKEYKASGSIQNVSVNHSEIILNGEKKVAFIDLGTKEASINVLKNANCEICLFPYNALSKEIEEYNPQGIFISDGAGDPSELSETIKCIKELLGKYPIFAVGMGHQILALANGCETEKMKYGHRGVNQPSISKETGKTYITSQNHGYCVKTDNLKENAKITFVNANDGSCEGMEYEKIYAFSVQFRPEGYNGPNNTLFLYDKFLKNMEDKVCL